MEKPAATYVAKFYKDTNLLVSKYSGFITTEIVHGIELQVKQHPEYHTTVNRLVDLRNVTHSFTKQSVLELIPILLGDLAVLDAHHTWLMEDAELIAWARYLQTKSEMELPVCITVSLTEVAEQVNLPLQTVKTMLLHEGPFDINV